MRLLNTTKKKQRRFNRGITRNLDPISSIGGNCANLETLALGLNNLGKLKMQLDQENITHFSKEFFNVEEVETLDKGENILRIEPYSKGGKCYLISKGGLHFAKMQEVISWN
jgi:hypothetical protein